VDFYRGMTRPHDLQQPKQPQFHLLLTGITSWIDECYQIEPRPMLIDNPKHRPINSSRPGAMLSFHRSSYFSCRHPMQKSLMCIICIMPVSSSFLFFPVMLPIVNLLRRDTYSLVSADQNHAQDTRDQ
jgi:hypothetical protein